MFSKKERKLFHSIKHKRVDLELVILKGATAFGEVFKYSQWDVLCY